MHVSVVKRVHPIADTHFHLGSWLLNSGKWALQFWWYDAILIKPVKSVDQPWLNPMVWRLNLIIFNIKLFYLRWLFHESGLLSYHICHILTSTYHITHFRQFDLRWSYDLAYCFPSESSQYPNKKVRYLQHHDFFKFCIISVKFSNDFIICLAGELKMDAIRSLTN